MLADTEPPVCQHCKQYGFECTFFLPITETRFKKKRLEEEAQAAAVQAAQAKEQAEKEKTSELEDSKKSPMPEGTHNVRIDGTCSFVLPFTSGDRTFSTAYLSVRLFLRYV